MGDCSTAPVSEIIAVPGLTGSVFVDGISENIASVGQCKRAIVEQHADNLAFDQMIWPDIRAL